MLVILKAEIILHLQIKIYNMNLSKINMITTPLFKTHQNPTALFFTKMQQKIENLNFF